MLFAFAGAYGGYKIKLPAGAMVGAIIGVAVLNLTVQRSFYYSDIRIGIQILSGVMIASKIGRKDIEEVRKIIFPTLFLLIGMVVLNLVFGGVMYALTSLDVATALFASAPGGMSDMAIISADLGANPSYVAILQLFRILVIMLCLPPIFKPLLLKRMNRERLASINGDEKDTVEDVMSAVASGSNGEDGKGVTGRAFIEKFAIMILIGTAGGLILNFLGVAAGALTGSMLATAVFCVLKGRVRFPDKLRFLLQAFSGAYIGTGIDLATIKTFPELLMPLIIMFIGIFFFVFLTGYLMHKIFKLDLAVCLLSSTPGGVQEMSLLSEDLGADTPKIAIMQTARLMCVIIFFPTMLKMITLMVG